MDKISEMLVKIKNAQMAGHKEVSIKASGFKLAIAELFKKEGFISDAKISKDGREIKVTLKYRQISPTKKIGAIVGIKKISRVGQRIYIKSQEIRKVKSGYGTAIISTPKGVMTGEESKKIGMGGEYLCEIW